MEQPRRDRQFASLEVVHTGSQIVGLYHEDASVDLSGASQTLSGQVSVERSATKMAPQIIGGDEDCRPVEISANLCQRFKQLRSWQIARVPDKLLPSSPTGVTRNSITCDPE
ncbi:hypothetical protein BRDID11004_19930 [Bradyrhizobium diazoefficiens]|uniref:Uncharacterized protein n=1 Tax=Bradyrhizobium diazoefficiens TaxID=1355477 RepID=A0A810A2L0_9BRAD|nr:hypothetical protein F07S3_69270 [Bradyrhizobium diazoefficiens]BCA06155.1 hypothetical protein H12S4_70590 [Bradyrhizobium diazoefficiens]BCA14783.1 hypothetical protein BDHF08_66300 [Bradyrhizobium diazoefficiens]BCA23507.1 hypothetical protein BDHH15_67220 [Bradyrhizobium diazoefficiens]BCE32886.1 hypothetical protein XF2B_66550 [Bradyrhizobium diazoefficiens]